MTITDFSAYYLVKYIIAGCAGVGKTSLAECYVDGKLTTATEHSPTIGVEFYPINKVIDDKNFKIQIWDTAGQEKFAIVVQSYYRTPHCAFICFAIDKLNSFKKVETIINDIISNNPNRHVDMVLVGTFLDKSSVRVIEKETAEKIADLYKIPYIEVSSKTGENVHECFDIMNKIVCERIDKNDDSIIYISNTDAYKEYRMLSNVTQRARGCCYSS